MKQIYIIALLALAIVSISSCGKQGDPTIIDVAEEKGEKYNGQHVRWKGHVLEDKKEGETTLFGVVVEKGYLAVIKLKKPLEKPIAKDTEFWFEGKVDASMKGDISAPKGGARMVFLEEGTIDLTQKIQESKTSPSSNTDSTQMSAESDTNNLTINKVMQDVDACKGKQVKWYGSLMSITPEAKILRMGFINAKVTDEEKVKYLMGGSDYQAFVAEFKADKSLYNPDSMGESTKQYESLSYGWITGTIEGTYSLNTSSPPSTKTPPKKVPLLKNAVFEKDSSNQ